MLTFFISSIEIDVNHHSYFCLQHVLICFFMLDNFLVFVNHHKLLHTFQCDIMQNLYYTSSAKLETVDTMLVKSYTYSIIQ